MNVVRQEFLDNSQRCMNVEDAVNIESGDVSELPTLNVVRREFLYFKNKKNNNER